MAFATDYIDVAQRIADFRAKNPEGTLQPANLNEPYKIQEIGGQTYIVVVAAAYRNPEDPRPGIGMAYEIFPGKTNFTRGSELQNAETSAWGRAIVAAMAGDTKKGIASAEEVRNRQAEQSQPIPDENLYVSLVQKIKEAKTSDDLRMVGAKIAGSKSYLTSQQVKALQVAWKERSEEL